MEVETVKLEQLQVQVVYDLKKQDESSVIIKLKIYIVS